MKKKQFDTNKIEHSAILNNSTNSIKHYRKRVIVSRPGTSSIEAQRVETLNNFIQEPNEFNKEYFEHKKQGD